MGTLMLGLITGIFFGFFLQKGQTLKYDKQVGMLRLQDFTILKVMASAILVGMVGVYFFVDMGMGELSLKPTVLAANIIGGLTQPHLVDCNIAGFDPIILSRVRIGRSRFHAPC